MQTDLIAPGCVPASAAFVQSQEVIAAPPAVAVDAYIANLPPAVLSEDDLTRLTSAMALPAMLVSELRSYISGCQAYNVDRPWILSECTIMVASLLTLGLENQLCRSSARWARLARVGRVQPVLLPISTDLCDRRVSATQGLCLLASAGGRMMEHGIVEIYGADDLVAPVPDRDAVRRLLGALPATVAFPPYLNELFYRATCALDKHSVQGAKLLDRRDTIETISDLPQPVVNIISKSDNNCFDASPQLSYNSNMDYQLNNDDPHRKRSFEITDGVELKVTPVRSPISSTRLNDILIGRSPSRTNSANALIQVKPEPKSPLSRRKMMQILMGKLPTSGDVD